VGIPSVVAAAAVAATDWSVETSTWLLVDDSWPFSALVISGSFVLRFLRCFNSGNRLSSYPSASNSLSILLLSRDESVIRSIVLIRTGARGVCNKPLSVD
jgi:hypothetical protein